MATLPRWTSRGRLGNDQENRTLKQWVLGSLSTPRALLGDLRNARRNVDAALDVGDESRVTFVEATLLAARVEILGQNLDRASDLIDQASAANILQPRWLQGWLALYRVDLLQTCASQAPQEWFDRVRTAWRLNKGYVFQRQRLLARPRPCSQELAASVSIGTCRRPG